MDFSRNWMPINENIWNLKIVNQILQSNYREIEQILMSYNHFINNSFFFFYSSQRWKRGEVIFTDLCFECLLSQCDFLKFFCSTPNDPLLWWIGLKFVAYGMQSVINKKASKGVTRCFASHRRQRIKKNPCDSATTESIKENLCHTNTFVSWNSVAFQLMNTFFKYEYKKFSFLYANGSRPNFESPQFGQAFSKW